MSHKLATSTRKLDWIIKTKLSTGNFNMFAQAQSKSVESRQFLSQSSVNLTRLPKGFVDHIAPKEGNKGANNVGEKEAADQIVDVKVDSATAAPPPKKSAPKAPNPLLLSAALASGQRRRYLTVEQALALGDRNDAEKDKETSSAEPGSGEENNTGDLGFAIIGTLGVNWVWFKMKKQYEDFTSNVSVDNFSGQVTVENCGMGMNKKYY